VKGIVSRDFGVLFLFHLINLKVLEDWIRFILHINENRVREHFKFVLVVMLPFGGFFAKIYLAGPNQCSVAGIPRVITLNIPPADFSSRRW
jgi:hypothetical protein